MVLGNIISGFRELKQKSLDKFANILYNYAGFVYDRPCTVILISLLCCLSLSMGIYYREHEKDIYKLYSISNSYAYEANEMIKDFFYKSRKAFILVESNCNLLQPHILTELKKFEDGTKEIKVDLTEVVECKKDLYNTPKEQTDVAKEVHDMLSKRIDPNTSFDWKPNFKKFNFSFALNKLMGLNNKNASTSKDGLSRGKKEGNDNDEDDSNDNDNDDDDSEDDDNDDDDSDDDGKNDVGKNDDGKNDDGKNDITNGNEHGSINSSIDRCKLQNVFRDKNINIDLRDASDALKKQITFSLEDICEQKYNECNFSSLFLYYENGNAKLDSPIKVDNLDFYVNRKTFKEMMFRGILGNMEYTETPFSYTITSANAILTVIPLINSYIYEPYVLAYEKKLIDYVRFYNIDHVIKDDVTNDGNEPYVRFHVLTERSLEDEVDRISKIDNLTRLLFLIGVLLIFMYALFNNVTSVLYRSKPLCAVMGIFCGFLGYLAGSGFLFFLGVKSVPPAETVPFLVIGVGVDDVFVILNSYSLLFMINDDKKRIQMCLKDSALAITVTTLTNIIAFLISAASPFYSICSFSLFTASSLFFGYLMVITLLLSILCIEAKLEKKKKNIFSGTFDLLCSCFRKKKKINDREKNCLVLEVQNDEDYTKTPVEYENISIYEWIHNLYLFEESINKKKKSTSVYMSNDKSSKGYMNDCDTPRDDRLQLEHIYRNNSHAKNGAEKKVAGSSVPPRGVVPDLNNNDDKNDNGTIDYATKLEENEKRRKKGKDVIQQQHQRVDVIQEKNKIAIINDIFKDKQIEASSKAVQKEGAGMQETPKQASTKQASAKQASAKQAAEKGLGNDDYLSVSESQGMSNESPTPVQGNSADSENRVEKKKEDGNSGSGSRDNNYGSNNMLLLKHYNNSTELATKDTLLNNMNETDKKKIYLLSSHDNVLFYKYIYEEPKGNIGKYFRSVIKNYYVPFLSSRLGKTIVYLLFTCILLLSLYGCTLMKKGIKYDKAFPIDSYVRFFTAAKMKYFPNYGDLIEVYYFDKDFINKYRNLNNPTEAISSSILYTDKTDREMMNSPNLNKNINWELKEIQDDLQDMHEQLESQEFVSGIANGFNLFLNNNSKKLNAQDNDKFYEAFVDWLQNDFIGNLFKNDFIFLNRKLVAWRFHFFQKNVDDSEISSKWMKACKEITKLQDHNIQMLCFHISSIFNETDEAIIEVTIKNLGITIITILIVTAYIVKGFTSCVIIAMIIFLIDLCIFGFMCLCGITVNIISMVILVLSVGFSIDHTSHIVQAFTHSMGRTRDEKMKESLHLMIGPVLHSGLSTWFVISTLFFSNKDFTVIFFQTLTL
ncbi:patched family protein, putative, partial [Plasmodium malariae]